MRACYPDCDGIATGWALEIDGETLAAAHLGLECWDAAATRRPAAWLACPLRVIHGTDDAAVGYAEGEALARCTGGALESPAGAGHFPHALDPARVKLLIKYRTSTVSRRPAPALPSPHQRKSSRHGEMEKGSAMAGKQFADRARR